LFAGQFFNLHILTISIYHFFLEALQYKINREKLYCL